MKVNIHKFIDYKRIDTLLEGFNKSTGFVTAILDLEGNVLSKSGWRQICTDFHRIHPDTARKCRTSDTVLANKMAEGEKYHFYECLNGLVDVAVPLVINGEHIANLFSGQFFFEQPNLTFFRKQAERYGFNQSEYLDAIRKVPVVSKEKVLAVVDFLLDMTHLISEMTLQKREQTELVETLRKSESRFRTIFENSLAMMLLIDPGTRQIVDANYAAEKFYGWSRQQLSQMTVDHINTLSTTELAAEMEKARSRDRIYFKFRHRLADGSERDVEVYSSKIEIDGKDYLHSIIHDITEQVKAINTLTKNEHILRLFVEHSPASIAMFDSNMHYLVVSRRYLSDYGLGDKNLVGRSHYEVFPEITDRWKQIHHRCLKGEILSEDEDRFPRADGKVDWVRWEIRPWYESDHRIGGIILFSEVVTRQIESREALRESEKHLRIALDETTRTKELFSQILDRISDGFASLDRNWNYTFVNERLAKNVGKKQEELLGHNIWEVFPQAIGTSVHKAYLRAMEEQVPFELEHFYPQFGRWFQHRFYPSPNGLSVFSKDIDDQKRAEEKIKEHSSLLRIAADKAKLGGWNVNLEENRSYWSDGVAAIHEMPPGYSPLIEDGINFYAPEWRAKITKVFTECATNGIPYDEEMEIITSTGKRVWIRTIGEAVRDENDKIYKVQGAFQDISRRKEDEHQIKTLNERLLRLVKAVQDLSVSTSMENIMETVRKSARELVNAEGSTFVMREGDSCYYADEDTISPLWKGQRFPMTECISGWAMLHRQPVIIEDIYSDSRIPIETYKKTFVKSLAMAPIRINNPLGAIGAYWSSNYTPTDIEIKLLNTLADAAAKAVENVQLIEGLESKIEKRTSQLTAANKELEAFTYSVSHDLRAPLRAINSFAEILIEGNLDSLNQEGRIACAIIKDNAIKMNKLINDLLKLSRVSQKEMLFMEIDMNAMVDKVFEEVTTEEQRQKISFNREELKNCQGDSSLITQVLVNLISNAVKYTGKTENPVIEINSHVSDTHVTYTIRDNGAGFDMKYADRLFNVFQRLHSEREFEGVGVGLAIVHRIISKHEGNVKAKGAVGQGAQFSFSLPVRNVDLVQ